MSGSAVATKKAAAVAAYDYGVEEGAGFENVGQDDLVLPFLQVLQSNSPQVADDGLAGAKAGMLHNSVTNELFDSKTGVTFVPAYTEHCFVEWVRRDAGGGFVAVHPVDSEYVAHAQKLSREMGQPFGKVFTAFDAEKQPSGHQLTETFYVYGVLVGEDGALTPAVVPFTSTKISPYKNWMTSLKIFRPKAGIPLFAHRTRFTTVKQEKRGQSFYNVVIAPAEGTLDASLLNPGNEDHAGILEAAKDVREAVRNGLARVAYDTANSETAAAGAGDAGDGETPPF